MTIAACRPSRRVVHVCPPFVFHGHGRNRTYLLDGLVKVIIKIVKSQLRWMTPPFWSFRAYILGESKSDFATIYDFACHACARAPCAMPNNRANVRDANLSSVHPMEGAPNHANRIVHTSETVKNYSTSTYHPLSKLLYFLGNN